MPAAKACNHLVFLPVVAMALLDCRMVGKHLLWHLGRLPIASCHRTKIRMVDIFRLSLTYLANNLHPSISTCIL